jgi:hypothetical protein
VAERICNNEVIVLIKVDRQQLWSEFLSVWPPERVRSMTLEEYTNPDRDDAFIYWVEARLQDLGSIWGGGASRALLLSVRRIL